MQKQGSTNEQQPGIEPVRSHQVTWPRGVGPALQSVMLQRLLRPATSGLSRRDLWLLCWAGEQFAARFDHLQALTGTSIHMVRHIVRRMRVAGVARQERIVVGELPWLLPTAEGLAACGLPYKEWKPTLGYLNHVKAVNDARIHVQTVTPHVEWRSERQQWVEYETRRPSGRARNRLPDGLVVNEGRTMAVEVELGLKGVREIERKLDELTRRYDSVLYYCAPAPLRALTRLRETGRWPKLGVRSLVELPIAKREDDA